MMAAAGSAARAVARTALLGLLVAMAAACGGPTSSKEAPILSVTPLLVDFGESRNSMTITVSNAGTGVVNWLLTIPSEGWISANRTSGTVVSTPVDVEIRIDREKAPAGTQEIKLTVTGAGDTQEITVRAVVRHAGQLSLSPLGLDFGETSTQQQVTVRNTGGEAMDWGAVTAQEWLSLAPLAGTLQPGNQQVVTVTIDRQKLGSGSNQGAVDFTSQAGSTSVPVLATGSSFGTVSASPTTLDFGTRNSRITLELRRIGGSGTLDWTVEASDSWIDPKTTSGALLIGESRTIFIEARREGLDPGAYQGTLTFRWSGGATAVVVALRVADEPVLALSDESLQAQGAEAFTFSVQNAGSGSLNWDITETAAWLQLSPTTGTTSTVPRTINGTIDRTGLAAGTYETVVHVESDGGSRDVPLVMEVPRPAVQITSGPDEGSTLGTDGAAFDLRAVQAYGTVQYSTRLDGDGWSAWGSQTHVAYADLEESALAGVHLFEARVRADAGESVALSRTFQVDAIKGPALRLAPKALAATNGQTVSIDLVAEEVTALLAARAVVTFDAARLELVSVRADSAFLGGGGGTVVLPAPEVDNAGGRVDLSVGVAGGTQAGADGTGVLAHLEFRVRRAGVVTLAVSTGSALRDLDNRSIPMQTAGCRLTAQ